jgi:hypothetical protein
VAGKYSQGAKIEKVGQQEKPFWKYLEIKVSIQGGHFPRKSQKGSAREG